MLQIQKHQGRRTSAQLENAALNQTSAREENLETN
jgi:hypothetical protein